MLVIKFVMIRGHLLAAFLKPMRRFIIKIYRLLYRITKLKIISFFVAILYISTLNLLTLYGLCLLLEDLIPTSYILLLFSFPYVLISLFITMAINFFTTPPLHTISAEHKKIENYTPVILYTILSLLLFAYTMCNA